MISCAVSALLGGWGSAAVAADQVASANTIETVVVSAERRDQSVQDVPTTIQAFTGQTLSDLNVTTLDDILKFTPNVSFGNNGPGQGEIFMRGLSAGFRGNQSSATIAGFPNVALFLDDQSMQFPARNLDIYMVDMERIEVLEGPQGTLFGGSAEAGAVRYITNKPKLDITEGKAEASYSFTRGGNASYAVNATLNLPIIDNKLAVRVVLYDDRQGGYIDNVPSTFTRSTRIWAISISISRPTRRASAPTICRPGRRAAPWPTRRRPTIIRSRTRTSIRRPMPAGACRRCMRSMTTGMC